MSKPKILLVEDNPQNRVLATFLLEEAGMEVVSAMTGAAALEAVRVAAPDLILLDIQLPDIDGYELLVRLKQQPESANIPVAAVSSYAMAGERKRALDLGCVGYLEKPIDTGKFAKQIAGFLGAGRGDTTILVVEDRVEGAVLLTENLQSRGYKVTVAGNGREALVVLGENKVDLIITDLLMPEMDGYQFTRAVKSDERFKGIPVIIYTATYTDEQDKALALELGAAEFIVKPAETAAFMRSIGHVLSMADRGGLPQTTAELPSESNFLRAYTETLVRKLEDKVVEAEQTNKRLENLNSALECRIEQATAELRASIDKLNAANKELESFSYSVAHDLRAPLRAINGITTILADVHGPSMPADARVLCQRLVTNTELMGQLIDDLLEYSRLNSSQFALTPVSLNAAVARAVAILDGVIEHGKAEINVQAMMPPAMGHEPTLVQVLSNLIGNAIKFVAPGIHPSVKITAEPANGRIKLNIHDNGIGIKPQYQDRIFNIFERLHDTDEYPGTGIGLAIVRKGVEKMGGTCMVESVEGQGSCFSVDLPSASGAFGGGAVSES